MTQQQERRNKPNLTKNQQTKQKNAAGKYLLPSVFSG